MMSLRQVTKTLPRASTKLTTPLARRTFIAPSKPSQLWRVSTAPAYRAAFSSAVPRFEPAGAIEQELSAKINSELRFEAEAQESSGDELPAHLKAYLDSNPWNVVDVPGTEEVTLTRRFGKENIKVVFSIADINEYDHDPDTYSEDPALYDEETSDGQQGGAQTKGSVTTGRTPDGNFNVESQGTPADRAELADDESAAAAGPENFPSRLQITITKDGHQGALYIDAIVRDGEIMTENVHYFQSSELADAQTAEKDWSRRALYTGPPFANLDEDLQTLFDQYAIERGIDTALALWVPEYMDYKEQREYVGWLQATKAFIDA